MNFGNIKDNLSTVWKKIVASHNLFTQWVFGNFELNNVYCMFYNITNVPTSFVQRFQTKPEDVWVELVYND